MRKAMEHEQTIRQDVLVFLNWLVFIGTHAESHEQHVVQIWQEYMA